MLLRKDETNKIFKSNYISFFIILLAISIFVVSTFAYFSSQLTSQSVMKFGIIRLSDDTQVGFKGSIKDALPGTSIINEVVKFKKADESQPLYIRVKLKFVTDSTEPAVLDFLNDLNSNIDFNTYESAQYGSVWSQNTGDYVYLMTELDDSVLFSVTNTNEYILSESIALPTQLVQSDNYAIYMQNIYFELCFQAIQTANLQDFSFQEIVDMFNLIFE